MRVGFGNDIHRLVEGRPLMLGGIEIPFDKGEDAHSDGDVLLHAISDAILGAKALGDIGQLFPDQAPQFSGADSLVLLQQVGKLLQHRGWRLGNLDATIVAQAPKMAPHIPQMRENIARVLQSSLDQVSIKATTEEGLGFTGMKQGIAAHAVCLIEPV